VLARVKRAVVAVLNSVNAVQVLLHPIGLDSSPEGSALARSVSIIVFAGYTDGRARRYPLTGPLICATCGRRLTAHWTHHKPPTGAGTDTPQPTRLRPKHRRGCTGRKAHSSAR
jgi:hypothetical protein